MPYSRASDIPAEAHDAGEHDSKIADVKQVLDILNQAK